MRDGIAMREGVTYSAILHLAVILLAIIGLPHLLHPPIEVEEAVPVEIVNIAPKTNIPLAKPVPTPEPKPVAPPAPPPLPAPEPAPPQAEQPPPPAPAPAPPEPTPQPEPPKPAPQVAAVPPPPPKPAPEPKPPPKPAPVKPAPQASAPPPVPQAPPKPKPPPDSELNHVLKNVLQSKPHPQQPDLKKVLKEAQRQTSQPDLQKVLRETENTSPPPPTLDQRLSMSEIAAITRQIEDHWNIPAGAKDAKDLKIELRVQLNQDGSVRNVSITDRSRLGSDSTFRAAAESAERAVYEAAPFRLPPEKYSEWQDMTLTFDPSQVL